MYSLIFVFIFLLGTIIGSFLNVVIYRLNTGKTMVNGRSICMTCNKDLRWYELIPVLSFLIQSGKCRRCANKISHQYPIVEVVTGLVFALVSFKFLSIFDVSLFSYILIVGIFVTIFSLLIVISVYDLRHKIIPDKLVYTFIIISFISIFINPLTPSHIFVWPTITALIAGPVLALPFASLWYFSGGKLMGLGDGKLILGMGWMLGLSLGFSAVMLAFWIGTVVSLLLMFLHRKKINMKSQIPFAPFLIIGTAIAFFFNLDIFSLIRFFTI